MRKYFSLVCLIVYLSCFSVAQAKGEFSSSYKVSYEVDKTGNALVTQEISHKNLTDNYYASIVEQRLTASDVRDALAFDASGPIGMDISKHDGKTTAKASLNQQVTGKDKVYKWTLKYKSKDYAKVNNSGVYLIMIPKISLVENLDDYTATMSFPVSLGDPIYISTEPKSQSELAGKLNFNFTKDQLIDSGVVAAFAPYQVMPFRVKYTLKNSSFLPKAVRLPLPPNSDYQEIALRKIDPIPDNVLAYQHGSYASFRLERWSTKEVWVEGLVKVYAGRRATQFSKLSATEEAFYKSAGKYWQKDNPLVKAKLAEVLKDVSGSSLDKARVLNNFVVQYLQFGDFGETPKPRLGGVTALVNPESAGDTEYTDLFITLSRSAGIASRVIAGTIFSNGDTPKFRVWPEVYDERVGWIKLDPQSDAARGAPYFNPLFESDRLTLSTDEALLDGNIEVSEINVWFSDEEFEPEPQLHVKSSGPGKVFAGFPASFKVRINNIGESMHPAFSLGLASSKVGIVNKYLEVEPIPAWGYAEYEFRLHSSLTDSFEDELIATGRNLGSESEIFRLSEKLTVEPFFVFRFFPGLVLAAIVSMLGFYSGLLGFHLKRRKKL